jgi:hypothetical protein
MMNYDTASPDELLDASYAMQRKAAETNNT